MARSEKFTPISAKKEYYSDFLMNLDMNPVSGLIAKVTNEDSIKQSLRNLILTNRLERPYQPLVGSRVRALLFELDTTADMPTIRDEIKETIAMHEPRVEVVDVRTNLESDLNALTVTIVFKTINNPQLQDLNLVLQRVR